VAYRVRTVRDLGEFRAALGAIGHYLGWEPPDEDARRFGRMLPLDRLHATFDNGAIVAGAGAFSFRLTVPGGELPCAGITVVGVLPTHRRRGLLTKLMRAQLADVRERGEPLAALWASEETIYGRYGYGMSSLRFSARIPRVWSGLRHDLPGPDGTVRLVDHDEALGTFRRLYERVRRTTVGFISRTSDWWEVRQLDDRPERRVASGGPLNRALLERDGRPVGYALYRIVHERTLGESKRNVRVLEAIGVDPAATRDVWRFLLAIDWTDEIEAIYLPYDHPLQLLVARVSKLGLRLQDGLWTRLVDVPAALTGRTYGGAARVEVTADPQFPENVGTWAVGDAKPSRTRRRPDVRVDVQMLGSVYLGGFSFAQLARAGLAEEVARGGIARADAAFRTGAAPWCPENF
jgi:predicted acetyltransferase